MINASLFNIFVVIGSTLSLIYKAQKHIKNGRQTKDIYIILLSVYIENTNIVLRLIRLWLELFI